jgi:hypothetical protein
MSADQAACFDGRRQFRMGRSRDVSFSYQPHRCWAMERYQTGNPIPRLPVTGAGAIGSPFENEATGGGGVYPPTSLTRGSARLIVVIRGRVRAAFATLPSRRWFTSERELDGSSDVVSTEISSQTDVPTSTYPHSEGLEERKAAIR